MLHLSDTHANSSWYSNFPTFHRKLGIIAAFRWSSTLVAILSQINPVHTLLFHIVTICLNITLPYTSIYSKQFPSFRFSSWTLYAFLLMPMCVTHLRNFHIMSLMQPPATSCSRTPHHVLSWMREDKSHTYIN